jgi:putative nucleotidyltransferase with HDIG domain
MAEEAPGSYHSSVMVAGMAEAAADAVGANALLARVAALYHDIGKLERPGFFVENQGPLGLPNQHVKLSPRLSYLVLVSHVRDGAALARRYRLPDEVTQILREHHGTTLVAYFYHRALSDAGDQGVNEQDFRYPGPQPSSREAGIVMLADSVQASVKAIKEPTPARIEHMVAEIMDSRLNDGQLERCDLTLRDLRQIREVFVRILTGLYTYTRIEYPDIKRESARSHVNTNPSPTPAARDTEVSAPRG